MRKIIPPYDTTCGPRSSAVVSSSQAAMSGHGKRRCGDIAGRRCMTQVFIQDWRVLFSAYLQSVRASYISAPI
ncbi:hypothetical protein DSECCO2_407050 [anaerobic digester metagenome]